MTTATDDKYTCYPIDEPRGRILLVAPDIGECDGQPDRLELSHCADGSKSGNWSDTDVVCLLTDDEAEVRQIREWTSEPHCWTFHTRPTRQRNQLHAELLRSLVGKAQSCLGWTFTAHDRAIVDRAVRKYGAPAEYVTAA